MCIRDRSIGPVGFALTRAIRNSDAWIGVGAEVADEGWCAEVHALKGLWAVDVFDQLELEKEGFEVGAGEAVFDATDAAGEMETARVLGGWLKESFEAGAEVGGAADVGFCVDVGSIEGEDGGGMGQLEQCSLCLLYTSRCV